MSRQEGVDDLGAGEAEDDCQDLASLAALNDLKEDLEAHLEFLTPGGEWGGAADPVKRAIAIGHDNRLTVTSLKRSSGNVGSDHHISQTTSYAADMSNGSSPTPQMDATAATIAARLGRPGWKGGEILTIVDDRVRVQLIWRTTGHFNHVHIGVRIRGRDGSRPVLRRGNRGAPVRELQDRLRAHGFDPGPIDGDFGPRTEQAVRAFQQARGLQIDGVVGPQTWKALGA